MKAREIRVLIASSHGMTVGEVAMLKQKVRDMFCLFGVARATVLSSTNDEKILDAAVGFLNDGNPAYDFVLYYGAESNCKVVERLNQEGVKTIIMNYITHQYSLATVKRKNDVRSETYNITYEFIDLP